MDNPYLARHAASKKQSPAYHRAAKHEKRIAEATKGFRVSRSGAGVTKGDVRLKGIARIECKGTQKLSFSVTRAMLDKIVGAAVANDEVPAIQIEFLDEKLNIVHAVAVVPYKALERLIDEARDARLRRRG